MQRKKKIFRPIPHCVKSRSPGFLTAAWGISLHQYPVFVRWASFTIVQNAISLHSFLSIYMIAFSTLTTVYIFSLHILLEKKKKKKSTPFHRTACPKLDILQKLAWEVDRTPLHKSWFSSDRNYLEIAGVCFLTDHRTPLQSRLPMIPDLISKRYPPSGSSLDAWV